MPQSSAKSLSVAFVALATVLVATCVTASGSSSIEELGALVASRSSLFVGRFEWKQLGPAWLRRVEHRENSIELKTQEGRETEQNAEKAGVTEINARGATDFGRWVMQEDKFPMPLDFRFAREGFEYGKDVDATDDPTGTERQDKPSSVTSAETVMLSAFTGLSHKGKWTHDFLRGIHRQARALQQVMDEYDEGRKALEAIPDADFRAKSAYACTVAYYLGFASSHVLSPHSELHPGMTLFRAGHHSPLHSVALLTAVDNVEATASLVSADKDSSSASKKDIAEVVGECSPERVAWPKWELSEPTKLSEIAAAYAAMEAPSDTDGLCAGREQYIDAVNKSMYCKSLFVAARDAGVL